MPKKSGRRVQLKRVNYQIKQALLNEQNPLPLFLKRFELINKSKLNYGKLIKID